MPKPRALACKGVAGWVASGVISAVSAFGAFGSLHASAQAMGQEICGSLVNGYGPYDYRREREGLLKIVEDRHFTAEVELLRRGVSGSLGGDLDYTLRASPNHHRALMAASALSIREQNPRPHHMRWTIECYFDRARRFQPDDVMVPMLLANHLIQSKKDKEASQALARAAELAAGNPLTHYNIGLLYLEAKDLDGALVHARKARDLGHPRTELLERLKTLGKAAD